MSFDWPGCSRLLKSFLLKTSISCINIVHPQLSLCTEAIITTAHAKIEAVGVALL